MARVLLLHDIHPATVAAMPGLHKALKNKGFYNHRSGRGGRRFKSCHSDQYLAEFHQSSGTDYGSDTSFVLVSSNICCHSGDHKPSVSAAALSSRRRGPTKARAVQRLFPSPIAERQANLPDFIALQKHHAVTLHRGSRRPMMGAAELRP